MKTFSIIILLLSCHLARSQKYADVLISFDDYKASILSNDSAIFWLDNILAHRDTQYLKTNIDTSQATQIKIVEVFDNQISKYGIRENYAINGVINMVFEDKMIDTFFAHNIKNYNIPLQISDSIHSAIVFFPPNTIEPFCGCGQVPGRLIRKCFKEAENQAKFDSITCEHFARLITYINRNTGEIAFLLEMPKYGQRQVYRGLTFDFSNKSWYYD